MRPWIHKTLHNGVVSSKTVVHDPNGVKYIVSGYSARRVSSPFDWIDIFWVGGWVVHIFFFWNRWKVEVTKLPPIGGPVDQQVRP